MTLHGRYLDYLVRRMRHLIYLTYRDIAVTQGLLAVGRPDPRNVVSYEVGPSAHIVLNGDVAHDATVITRLLSRTYRQYARICDSAGDAESDAGSQISAGPVLLPHRHSADLHIESPKETTVLEAKLNAGHILSILRTVPRRLRPDDVAVSIQLAIALDGDNIDTKQLASCLNKSAWFLGVAADVSGFCATFARLLESGALLRRQYRLRDGNSGYSISGRVHLESSVVSNRTAISLRLKELVDIGPERSNRLLTKALKRHVPIIIAEEDSIASPPRLMAAADLWLVLPTLDASIVRVTIAICTGYSLETVTAEIRSQGLICSLLTMDDLVLGIDPDRPIYDIINRLVALTDTTEAEENATKQSRNGGQAVASASTKREPVQSKAESRSGKPKPVGVERIEPLGASQADSKDLPLRNQRMTVETLAGYGPARNWALDLKSDLVLWRDGKLPWADMSTKLVLSGPPGTGKTTFARALCNTLELPLFASSVSTWLEPGYLGEVLRRMSDTFSAAQKSAPSILFIDELDGIGSRGNSSRPYDDYWNQLVNRALELLDGSLKSEGVVIVGATNFPEKIDKALLRSGRLETHIAIPMPDTNALEGILRFQLGSDLDSVVASIQRQTMPKGKSRRQKGSNNG